MDEINPAEIQNIAHRILHDSFNYELEGATAGLRSNFGTILYKSIKEYADANERKQLEIFGDANHIAKARALLSTLKRLADPEVAKGNFMLQGGDRETIRNALEILDGEVRCRAQICDELFHMKESPAERLIEDPNIEAMSAASKAAYRSATAITENMQKNTGRLLIDLRDALGLKPPQKIAKS